jgi:threonine dehydratase
VSVAERKPTPEDIAAAAVRVAPLVWHTPLIPSPWLSDLTRADVWLKLESVQATGSFKMRGAANALACLHERAPQAAVVTASAGNHGLAVAAAGKHFGLRVRVHLPAYAPATKRTAMARFGAEIVEAPTYDDAERQAHEEADNSSAVYVSPYNDDDVIAGAATVAAEMLDDRPDLDAFVVPVGGGGLLAATAVVARARQTEALVVGAEAAASPVFTSALRAGRPVTVDVRTTLADGLAGNMDLDSRTFPLVRDLVDRVAAVREDSIADAMRNLLMVDRLVVEGAAATGVAAALEGLDLAGRRVGFILSGRNIDPDMIERVATSGASAGKA